MDYKALKAQLATDPLARGYAAMTDAQTAADLNTAYRTRTLDRMNSADVFENINRTEFTALTAAQQARVDRILGLGEGILVNGKARQELIAVFGGSSSTVQALAAAVTVTISRATELGIPVLSSQMIGNARTIAW